MSPSGWILGIHVYHVLAVLCTLWSTSQRLCCLEVSRWRANLQQRALTQLVQHSLGTEQGGAYSLCTSSYFAREELTFWAYCIFSAKSYWKIIWHYRHLVAFLEASVISLWQRTQGLGCRKRESTDLRNHELVEYFRLIWCSVWTFFFCFSSKLV